ncbi:uncharacterized protein LOC112164102 [Rosa chinensis]|uniref:uncharacterized protein LOC112164102 n=1 Tax=Rosa chinensis TaxID=74649 RepID=UPI000D096DB5|nr:uncharacterized protein LOC112164102 [Rosa chinensis]
MVLWSLWKNRNGKLWNDTCQPAHVLMLSSLAWLDEFCKARQMEKKPTVRAKTSWTLAPDGQWKLNVDGSFLPSLTHGGTGGVLRYGTCDFKATFANHVTLVASTKHTELIAIRDGLKLLQDLQAENVIVELDCLEVAADIVDLQALHIAETGIIDDIRGSLEILHNVRINHVSRSGNMVAHRLAAAIAYEADIS